MIRKWLSLLVVTIAVCPSLLAQQEVPRTEHGQPDLQGTYSFRTLTPLQRPRELADRATLTKEEAEEWAAFENNRQNRDLIIDSVGGAGYPPGVISYNEFWYDRGTETVGDYRTSLIFDPSNGRLPPLSAVGKERAAYTKQLLRDSAGPEARTLNDRCILNNRTGPPMISGAYNNNMQLVQTEHYVMIMSEMIHHARIIPFANDNNTSFSQWTGNSIARWEGDTLVVNTQNFYPDYGWRNTSPDLKVEERFTWINENALNYEFTVEDPNTWERPWSGKQPMLRMTDQIYEFACHEGNHGMAGILAGWRRWEVEGKNSGPIPSVDDEN